jgi:glycosyltransferase involved in cell wall biosynthesis
MPVYNGEKYVRQALDSLLTQNFKDFELIISDNASTDNTAEICKRYLEKDNRIEYYRNGHHMMICGSLLIFRNLLT